MMDCGTGTSLSDAISMLNCEELRCTIVPEKTVSSSSTMKTVPSSEAEGSSTLVTSVAGAEGAGTLEITSAAAANKAGRSWVAPSKSDAGPVSA